MLHPAPRPRHQAQTLLVCDHRGEGLLERLQGLAGTGVELIPCRSVGETRAAILGRRASLVVLDPLVPGGHSELELLGEARTPEGSATPFLLVVDPAGLEPAAGALRDRNAAPWDLARRDAPLEELQLRVECLLARVEERRELERVRYEAHHDDRTGLLRPIPFEQRLREHFSAAQRHGLSLALVLIDLDRFGQINKTFDHTVGDDVITRAGEVIQSCLRAEDVGGRLGGDEFAVVLPYTRAVDAAHVVQRLLEKLHGLSGPGPRPGTKLEVSGSVGFETYANGDVESVEALRRRAESALRRAKERGGNVAVYFRSLADTRASGPEPGAEAATAAPDPLDRPRSPRGSTH